MCEETLFQISGPLYFTDCYVILIFQFIAQSISQSNLKMPEKLMVIFSPRLQVGLYLVLCNLLFQ